MEVNERFEDMIRNLDEHYSSKMDIGDLPIDNLSDIDLLNLNESDLSENLMKALATVDLFTLLKDFSKKQLAIYEKVLTDVYHIVEMVDLNDTEQKKVLGFQKELLIRRRKIKELNNVFDLVPKRPGDTQERLNKLSVIGERKEQLQYSLRSKNVFGGVSDNAKKLGIYKGGFIESQRIKISQTNENNIRKLYTQLIESIVEDNKEEYSNQSVRTKILKFINKSKK
ncbi:hypothetical protein NGB78_12535 [Staphylococcus arlettae]|uniref:hypothetical protein n=1 Tax=Staphylococcus TaxID=1279 RepID=UPI001AEBB301|nr:MULTISPECIES: hypothetical protein [Staphylococcus]MEB6038125.1 hypothetical protein [Staphylococcus pseudoxylosus]MEB6062117.1 hypothetical protein [Staphylococcus pseudoxylosus]MEB7422907.1 hypothetical protein [Staphylococcus arlettae]MEB7765378.1 hypothetical protein [Staphylococcus pseudoxylosus]MEB8086031.1 hypothetical protein [Staphylococcus pseudoxylosus]